jgi:hypothetical protein
MRGFLEEEMDNLEWKESKRILRGHKEISQANNSDLLHVSVKILELD